MKKISKRKILFIVGLMAMSAISYGKDVFANYSVNFGKVNLTKASGISPQDAKRIDGTTYQLVGNGEYRIMEEGGRRLVVNVNNGVLNGNYTEYYANGNNYTTGKYVNGKKEGEWLVYSENGKLWKRYQYSNDELNGRYSSYYGKTGNQETVGQYQNGKMTGNWTEYYENGSRKSQGTYVNGYRNGLFTEWNSSGSKSSEINYQDDQINEPMKVYYENGNLLYEANLNNGVGTLKGYYTNGAVGFTGNLNGRRRVGTWTYYDKSGNSRTVNH
ncbi:toxin-antitoxin system YwqK family antitoxin [Leptotrichia sp. oral taxon 847]|uniref:toxin-antitoxin system YwqK family antitoxin n=1 Tax=Leptotrichia sp. oral taxon 847 TaxID=1785996 RepID=UPI000767E4B0|nr:toxin-antitoxin system YwqK family antitoxin [Leptotrichia sp. oral taxon 847]AMD95338.1 hypothetical protein AXF11_06985 [Leptotrichia sp. oral taxon 847]